MNGALERFSALVQRPQPEIPLDEAAMLLAAHAYPGLDVDAELARIDLLADTCQDHTFDGLCRHLFEELGFSGNTHRYGDPRNSFLNDVLSRRVGIPISLCVLTMEVARRIDVVLAGVGMPGHFLVRHDGGDQVYLDPFGGGRRLSADDCATLFRSVHGPSAPLDPRILAPVGPRAILVRMLANLRQVYSSFGDARSLGWVLRLRAAIPTESPADQVDLASALASLGRFGEAAAVLEALADQVPAPGADQALAQAASLRARLN